jgi:hypothetical protein
MVTRDLYFVLSSITLKGEGWAPLLTQIAKKVEQISQGHYREIFLDL